MNLFVTLHTDQSHSCTPSWQQCIAAYCCDMLYQSTGAPTLASQEYRQAFNSSLFFNGQKLPSSDKTAATLQLHCLQACGAFLFCCN